MVQGKCCPAAVAFIWLTFTVPKVSVQRLEHFRVFQAFETLVYAREAVQITTITALSFR